MKKRVESLSIFVTKMKMIVMSVVWLRFISVTLSYSSKQAACGG